MTIEPFQRIMAISDVYVTQMIHLVTWAHHAVLALDHMFVHIFHRTKTATSDQAAVCVLKAQYVLVSKMRVTDYPDFVHYFLIQPVR